MITDLLNQGKCANCAPKSCLLEHRYSNNNVLTPVCGFHDDGRAAQTQTGWWLQPTVLKMVTKMCWGLLVAGCSMTRTTLTSSSFR